MKISERSWHLRLARWVRDPAGEKPPYTPRDLCGYFWFGIVGTWLMLVMWLVTTIASVGLAALFAWMVFRAASEHPSLALPIVSAVAVLLAVLLIAKRESVQRSVPVTYLKAKKRRLCPLIEVVE